MTLEILKMKLIGDRPLLLHNGQLADPTNKHARRIKELAAVKNKTDQVYEDLRQAEWLGSMYFDAAGRPCVTEDMILGCAIEGARKSRNGKKVQAGVLGSAPTFRIEYDGPVDPMELYQSGRFCDYRAVVVSRGRVMRARPRFDVWAVDVELAIDTSSVNVAEVISAVETAGKSVGLGDFRPRFGRFRVEM